MKSITTGEAVAAAGCLHRWYLECHGNPSVRREDRVSRSEDAYKRQCVAWLEDVQEPAWNGRDAIAGHRDTVRLMERGHAWILGGVLAADGLEGRPDLLKRVEGRSRLGPFTYVPARIAPSARGAAAGDVHELQFHALLLEPHLGVLPASGWIYRPDGLSMEVDLRSSWPSFSTLLDDLRRIARGELLTEGYRCSGCRRCPWIDHCRKVWTQLSHVCLLPGMDRARVGAFREGGFASWSSVAAATPERVAHDVGLPLDRARLLWLHAKAFQSGRALLLQPAPFPPDVPVHFYFAEFRRGRCALHGDLRMLRGEVRTRQFLAGSPGREGAAWHAFLDHLARDERAIVFSWSDRAARPLESMWERHGGNAKGWRLLNRERRSLHRFLREQAILPLSDYDLRAVASFFSFKWPSRTEPGSPFPLPWERDLDEPEAAATRAFLNANRDRIEAMKSVYVALQSLQERSGAA